MTTSKTQTPPGVRPFVVYNYEEGKDPKPTVLEKDVFLYQGLGGVFRFQEKLVKIETVFTTGGFFDSLHNPVASCCYYYTDYAVVDEGQDLPLKVIDCRLLGYPEIFTFGSLVKSFARMKRAT